MKPYLLSARETVDAINRRELTTEECVTSVLTRAERVDDRVHAFVTLTGDHAKRTAENIDRRLTKGEAVGRLAGVCVAVKDNLCTASVRTTCSSRMLEQFIPPYNATVVERLLYEDAIIVGKTNMDEFAMGSSTENSHFGPTHNPWDLSRVPGGSSGGSAAAVSASEATIAYGTDTGGSVRCPASFCSTVGLKPTYGAVSRYGLIAYANSLEQIGPIAKDVYDCALLFSVMVGRDPKDSTSVATPSTDYTQHLAKDVEGVRIGVPKEFFGEGTEEGVAKAVWDGIHRLDELGASHKETTLPNLKYALPAYYLIAMSEASSNLARYDGLRYGYRVEKDVQDWSTTFSKNRRTGFGPEVRRRIILGTYALSAGYYDRYYLKALQVRTLIKMDFERAFEKFDVVIGPTMPIPPFRIGEKVQDPLEMYMCDVDTVPINLAGVPALSVPCGFSNDLPVGMQIIAPPFREDLLFRVGYALEQSSSWRDRRPEL